MGTLKNRMMTKKYEYSFNRLTALKPVYRFFDLKDTSNVLDYGCGKGWISVLLAQKAKNVYAIDISSNDIEKLKKIIENKSITNIFPYICDAENLIFEDEFFDFVFGNAILHHLHLDTALSEVNRVLKKGGKAAFCEPYGHNPVLNIYRFVKDKYIKRVKGIHRPLRNTYKKIFEKYFTMVEFIETGFTSDRIPLLRNLESKIIKRIPIVRKWASYVTILLIK